MVLRCGFRHEGNCSASRGLASDAEQLSRMTEFSVCPEQPLWIFFLTCSSFTYNIKVYIQVILSVLRQNIYIFDQEIFGSAAAFAVDVRTFGRK